MALLPENQSITIERGGDLDEWGNAKPDSTQDIKCRVDEGSFIVQYKAGGSVTSKEVVANARIIKSGLIDIRYDDIIVYVNELGNEIRQSPKKIEVKRMINGKPAMTVFFL